MNIKYLEVTEKEGTQQWYWKNNYNNHVKIQVRQIEDLVECYFEEWKFSPLEEYIKHVKSFVTPFLFQCPRITSKDQKERELIWSVFDKNWNANQFYILFCELLDKKFNS